MRRACGAYISLVLGCHDDHDSDRYYCHLLVSGLSWFVSLKTLKVSSAWFRFRVWESGTSPATSEPALSRLPSITILDIHAYYNQLSTLDIVSYCPNLESLSIAVNSANVPILPIKSPWGPASIRHISLSPWLHTILVEATHIHPIASVKLQEPPVRISYQTMSIVPQLGFLRTAAVLPSVFFIYFASTS